jgi:uncharacterized SAM-binding protein YcdF (DUF218 family)
MALGGHRADGHPLTATHRRRTWWILAWTLASVAAIAAVLTFVWFVVPDTAEIATVDPADAVVVFAGSPERLETAIELMERGAAPNLVIPNGATADVGTNLCRQASFQVFCPDTGEISTWGEARAIARLAEENGWSRLIAVTSVYHVHRATSLLRKCHDGPVEVVSPPRDVDLDWVGKVGYEWAGYLASFFLNTTC